MDKMRIYNSMPVFAQNFACEREGRRLAKLRYGGDFQEKLADYNLRVHCSQDKLISIRNEKLQAIVSFCYREVPYYKKVFDEAGVNPACVKSSEDLSALPILDKQTVREKIEELKPRCLEKIPHIIEHTSGSTGSSLIFPQSIDNVSDIWAVYWRFRNRCTRTLEVEQ